MFIKSKMGDVLDVTGASTANAAVVGVYPRKPTGFENQQWSYERSPSDPNAYFIISSQTGKYLSVNGDNRNSGATIIMWPKNADPAHLGQLWYFVASKVSGFHFIRSKLDGMLVSVKGGIEPAPVVTWPETSSPSNNQLWAFDGGVFPPYIPPEPIILTTTLQWLNIGTGQGTANGGETKCAFNFNLSLQSNGDCHFWGEYTNRGDIPIITAPDQSFAVVAVVFDRNGKAFSFNRANKIPSAPQSGCTDKWDQKTNSVDIKENWASLVQHHQITWHVHTDANFWDLFGQIGKALGDAIKDVGVVAGEVKTVIEVVGPLVAA